MNDKLMQRLSYCLQRVVKGEQPQDLSMTIEDAIYALQHQPLAVNEFTIQERLNELYPYADIKYVGDIAGVHTVMLFIENNEVWRCDFDSKSMKWKRGQIPFETMQELESAFAIFIQSIGTQLERAK